MSSRIGNPMAPGIGSALAYLKLQYDIPAKHVRHIVIRGGCDRPTEMIVTLVVQDGDEPASETVRFEPGCLCPRNAAGRVGTDPGCPMHQPGAAGLADVPTERVTAPGDNDCARQGTCTGDPRCPTPCGEKRPVDVRTGERGPLVAEWQGE